MRILIALTLTLVFSACAGDATDPSAAGSPARSTAADGPTAAATTVSGVLGGDPQLEGGCVWLDTADGRVEVIWPEGFEASADPVEVRDDNGAVVATAGDEVEIVGAPATGRVSTCQVGEIWTAIEVRAG